MPPEPPSALAEDAPQGNREGALLAAHASGDREATRKLLATLAPRVLAQATRMLADRAEAEDVTHEVFLRLWRVAPEWPQGEARVSTWIYRVTANLCTDCLRRRRRSVALEEASEAREPSPSAPDRMQGAARLRALSDVLASLPERQARAVSLRHLEGLSNPEIASVMDIGVEAIESLIARGRRALAALLGGRQAELGYDNE